MGLIKLGKIDKTLINPLIPTIIMALETIFWDYFETIHEYKAEYNIIQSISKCIAIIPFIIFKLKNKISNNQKQIDNKLKIKVDNEKHRVNKLKKGGFIVLINVLNVIFKISYYRFINIFISAEDLGWYLINFISIPLFSFLILKAPIYKHQYLCIIITFSAGITLNAIHHKFDNILFRDILINLFGDGFYSLMIVLKRYAMVNLFCSAYEIVFYEGIFSLFVFIIILIILTNVEIIEKYEKKGYIIYEGKAYIDNFYAFIELLKNDKTQILICIIMLIYCIPHYIFFNLTIQNNSVFHILIILLAEEGLFFEYEKDTFIICMNIFLTIILLFMFLVFIEIIELNFCGLSTNLKRNIADRAEIEVNNNKNRRDTLLEMDGQAIDFNNI